LRPQQVVRDPDGSYQLFRIGDAVAGRNIHAAIYDGRCLCIVLCSGHFNPIDILDRCKLILQNDQGRCPTGFGSDYA